MMLAYDHEPHFRYRRPRQLTWRNSLGSGFATEVIPVLEKETGRPGTVLFMAVEGALADTELLYVCRGSKRWRGGVSFG